MSAGSQEQDGQSRAAGLKRQSRTTENRKISKGGSTMYCYRKVKEDLYWVGANDRRLAMFEGVYWCRTEFL